MTEPAQFHAIPTLRIGTAEEAKKFYADILGFTVDWEHYHEPGAPVYMQVSRGGMRLMLTGKERFPERVLVYVETEGIHLFHEELSGRGDGWNPPPVTRSPWQTEQMEIEDPFGNTLRFHQLIEAARD